MENIINDKGNYINVLNRIQRKISSYEPLFIMKKQYMTNSTIYYFLCIIFRFLPLLFFCGNYNSLINFNKKNISIMEYIDKLSCYNLVSQFNISFSTYIVIIIIIIILLIYRLLIMFNILRKFHSKNTKQLKNYILPNNYQIIIEHIIFLFFPYIIDYLFFIYYIYFLPNNFIIKPLKY